ncbi:cuticle protein 16.8 [Nephila pilipes]|uniref:Cuticle protein 16.8 n=1 Tax=Nephila pilipes TaxID=299642 RepID=A0A8X6TRV8_NEPPI|nr:cuticle protein 16.8 [Nephila pilipes]
MMFKALLLCSVVAVALAQYGHGYAAPDYAQPIPYQYGYDIAGDHGEFKQTRQEHGDGHGNLRPTSPELKAKTLPMLSSSPNPSMFNNPLEVMLLPDMDMDFIKLLRRNNEFIGP